MSILSRPRLLPQQRYDLEDFDVQLAALRADAQYYTSRFLSEESYIIRGFTIADTFLNQATCEVSLEKATLINPDNTSDFSWWTAADGASPITIPSGTGGLQEGRNFIELELYTDDGTPLQRAFWDPTANGGAGLEFTNEVDTVTDTFCKVVVNQSNFNTGNKNRIPLAIIDVDSSVIKGILDRRNLFFRLGSPDAQGANYTWSTRLEPSVNLVFDSPSGIAFSAGETVTFSGGSTAKVRTGGTNNVKVYLFSGVNFAIGNTVTGGTSGGSGTLKTFYESFEGADKDLKNYRELFKALLSEIKAIKGTDFWFQEANASLNEIVAANLKRYSQTIEVVSGVAAGDDEIQGPVASGETIDLPADTRSSTGGNQYLVGSGCLMVFLNGILLEDGLDYDEIGSAGATSTQILLNIALLVGDILQFRIASPQAF